MKLQPPERIRRERAANALQGEVEPTTRHFDVERDVRPQDKERIISDLIKFKADFEETADDHLAAWGDPTLFSSWLGDFERCTALFPDSLERLDNTPEQWERILTDWKVILPRLIEEQWEQYVYLIEFIWAHFPDRRSEFPVDLTIGKRISRKIQKIQSRNPINSEAILLTLKSIRTLLPDLFATLAKSEKGIFKSYPKHLDNPRKASELAARLANIRLVFPEVFETLSIPTEDWAVMKARLGPINPNWESDFYLGDAYHLRIIAADEARLGDNGELILKDSQTKPAQITPRLPERYIA